MIVQTYWSPIPPGAGIRYAESGWTRQNVGGCGVWNRDADWANNTAVVKMNQALTNGIARTGLSNYVVLDMSSALNGRGDLFVSEFSAFGRVHRFNRQ